MAGRLVRSGPDVIRGNSAEIEVLASAFGLSGAAELAASTGAVVLQSGPVDIVFGDHEVVTISNGHTWMRSVTAMGCAGGALAGRRTDVARISRY